MSYNKKPSNYAKDITDFVIFNIVLTALTSGRGAVDNDGPALRYLIKVDPPE